MIGFIHIMTLPFFSCLILTGIFTYLGLHVIERGVIFVDLALAQIAALGLSFSLVLGLSIESGYSYWVSLGFAMLGSSIFSLTRFKKQHVPQEVIIGITYVISAALMILVLSRSGEGDEHIKEALVGNILLVSPQEALRVFMVSLAIGVFHFIFRRNFILISQNPQEAFKKGLNVRFWDFLFYASLGLVVTSAVKLAGVLLVFSFLIVPATCAILFAHSIRMRLMLGWIIGSFVSLLGMAASYYLDFPTGASVVCVFGCILVFLALVRALVGKFTSY
jgi:zinc/manganese transport system permease protein